MASRYIKGDKVIYRATTPAIVLEVGRFYNGMSWQNNYQLQLEHGDIIEAKASQIKLFKPSKKKRISFKSIKVPDNWKYLSYSSSNYYDYKAWEFEDDKDNTVTILQHTDTNLFSVQWSLKRTTVEEFKVKNIKIPEETTKLAYDIMVKINNNEISFPKWLNK